MRWFSQLLVTTLVTAGIFVVAVSGCQSSLHLFPTDGGSCSEAQLTLPPQDANGAALPAVRFLPWVILVVSVLFAVPKTDFSPQPVPLFLARGNPHRVQFALRD
jgi:hypothetical protein